MKYDLVYCISGKNMAHLLPFPLHTCWVYMALNKWHLSPLSFNKNSLQVLLLLSNYTWCDSSFFILSINYQTNALLVTALITSKNILLCFFFKGGKIELEAKLLIIKYAPLGWVSSEVDPEKKI